MIAHDFREAGGRRLLRPFTLPFGEHGHPDDRHGPDGDHAAHGHVVGFGRDAARGVGDDEHVIALAERQDRRQGQADLWQETGAFGPSYQLSFVYKM
ncbi:hypothetical protein [Caulobacter sp. LARHSG274]